MHSWLNKIKRKLSLTRILQASLALYVVYLLLAYFAVNPIAQKWLPKIANDKFASVASVGEVAFDPLRLKATINDFSLSNQDATPLLQFKTLIIDFNIAGMFKRAWQFKQIALVGPEVNVSVNEHGSLNWQPLMDQLNKEPSPPTNTIPRLIIEQIGLARGKLIYTDHSKESPVKTVLTPLGFQLNGFSTLPQDRGDYLIAAVFAEDGGRLKWKGDMGVNPIASTGILSLEGVHLANMLELVQGLALPITFSSGDMQASFKYHFAIPKSVPDLKLSDVSISLENLSGTLQGGGSLGLTNTSLQSPTIHFIKSKQPALHIEQLAYQLDGFQYSQANQMQLMLKQTTAHLPNLDILFTETPEMHFDQLGLALSDIIYEQGQQFSVMAPSLKVDNISYDLAESRFDISQVKLSDISLLETDKSGNENKPKPLAKLNSLSIEDSSITLKDKQVNLSRLSLTGFDTDVVRDKQGVLNWLELFSTQPAKQSLAVEVPAAQALEEASDDKQAVTDWALNLNKITLNDASAHILDHTTPQPIVLDIVKATAEIDNASLDLSKPVPVKATFRVKQGGLLNTSGQLSLLPFKSDMRMRLNNLSLKPFAPYINQLALLKLKDGEASLSGRVNMQQQSKFSMAFNGGFNVNNLSLVEEEDDAPFLSWDAVKSKDAQFALGPDKLHIGTLELLQPAGKFIINADKTMNVQQILRSAHAQKEAMISDANKGPETISKVTAVSAESVAAQSFDSLIKPIAMPQVEQTETPTATEKKRSTLTNQNNSPFFPVTIDRVVLQDAKLAFADLSLITPFGTNIHSLNGVLNGLSTQADKVAQVELDGKVDEYGSARIRGALQPFQATDFTDVTLAFTNLDMSKLTPYSGKFAGRRIDAGKLSVDLGYKIKNKQLVGENKLVVNKIKLGEKVDSPEAADLPLDLAIAILEDSDGVIDLDLPISGSLEDPKFSYGSIVWKAFTNVLTKIVTAPFKALGKLFGGDGENFDGILFEAGLSEVAPPEQEKLAKISEALGKRKNLALGIVPSYHKQSDIDAIKRSIYRQQVAKAMDIELREGQKAGPVDLGSEVAQKAITQLHDKLTKKGFFKRMADKFDEPEAGYFEKAQAALIASIEVSDKDLVQLAQARGEAIYKVLVQQGVAEKRLKVLTPVETKVEQEIKAELTLDVKKVAITEELKQAP